MIKLECKDCTKRQVGCHSKCESYLAYKREREELAEKRKIAQSVYPERRRRYR